MQYMEAYVKKKHKQVLTISKSALKIKSKTEQTYTKLWQIWAFNFSFLFLARSLVVKTTLSTSSKCSFICKQCVIESISKVS